MEKKTKLSILVPCYNVEKFLNTCLSSISGQTFEDFEVICINDGSTDSTLSILKDWQIKDNRFIIVNKQNTGYGDSMNIGLSKAKGDYIGIVESDDFIDKNMYERLIEEAEKDNLQISRCCYFKYSDSGKELVNNKWVKKNFLINPKEDLSLFLQPPSIWAAIYKRSWLLTNKISFLKTPGASYQDTSFAFKCYACCERFKMIPDGLLYYRIDNEGSSIHAPQKISFVCSEWNEIFNFVKSDKEKFENFGTILFLLQFGTYKWNYKRINNKKNKAIFLKSWLKEVIFRLKNKDYNFSIFNRKTFNFFKVYFYSKLK